ncbi:transmembrane adaptor Erv26-domain-containing protein [Helicostylum pulchrum]|nr:transmembrane adaptor Erv26-domain-containing protein [Helicostylum pulchrum]
MTVVIISFHILFWIFDRLPFFYLAFSVGCHVVYSLNLKTFPFISLSSVPFVGSCILVFANHFLWFKYFTTHYRPFMDIAAFFGLCVWLVPFAYFISLSANDNALPTSDSAFVDTIPNQQKQGLMKTLMSYVGIKGQDTSMPVVSSDTPVTDYSYNTSGMTSGMHYMPTRDIQNRKAA